MLADALTCGDGVCHLEQTFYHPSVNWLDVVDCPPIIQLPGDPPLHAYLLAWIRMEVTGEWRAVITYIRQVGEKPAERMLVDVSGQRLQQMMPPAAYASVPRLQLCADGTIQAWEPPPPSEP